MRPLHLTLISAGIIAILTGIIISPDFIAIHISSDHVVSPEVNKGLQWIRFLSMLIGGLMLTAGFLSSRYQDHMRKLISHPVGTILLIIFCWTVLVFINLLLKLAGMGPGTPDFFPLSEVFGPRIRISGLPYSLLFLLTLFVSLRYKFFNLTSAWVFGTFLIIFGNLAQGGPEEAFYKPITASDYFHEGIYYYEQYYHEAIGITDWREWLGNFNANLLHLKIHARTHPPLAVLLHYFFIKLSNHNLPVMSGLFIGLSSASIAFVYQIMKLLDVPERQRFLVAILFSVIPAYNIFSAISLDGAIISFGALFLTGFIHILKRGLSLPGFMMFFAGLLLVNLHTYLGLFLLGTSGIVAMHMIIVHRKFGLFKALVICLLLMLFVHLFLDYYYGYSHIKAFLTASSFEDTTSILDNPVMYIMTRLENGTMFAIFLSLAILALFFHPSILNNRIFDWRNDVNMVFVYGIAPLVPFLLMGGLYTGEIARICLFMYLFFVLILTKLQERWLRILLVTTGIQTAVMQTIAGYFW
ncbi:MAG: hypothetical protein C4560_07240 [Nitrospiraceae bacterium]|nr:MAG: hypothetical protein C4560_07240 [Nitrospiraceae bacterium]